MSTLPPTLDFPVIETVTLPMCYKDYLVWSGEDGISEWVDGQVIVHATPDVRHQELVSFLNSVAGWYVSCFRLGVLYVAPLEVKLWPNGPSREPDLLFLAESNLDRVTPDRVVGPPDLIIEIVSDDSVHRDCVNKYGEYERAGVPEYWIIDNRPGQQRALFYQLAPECQYQRVPIEEDGIYRSAVLPGFWLRVDWLWQENLNFLPALAELIGPDQLAEALRRTLEQK